MNEQIKKIRAELERRMKGGCGSHYEYTAYQSILSFIDSLEESELNTNLIRTSQEALETLQMAGILDENGELTEPYRSTDMQQREGVNPFDAALMGFTASVMENDGFNFTENSDCIAFDFWKNHLLSVAKKLLNDELATNPNMESSNVECGKLEEQKAKDCKISEEICQNFTKPSDLEEEIDAASKRYPEVSFAKLSRIAKHFAQWGAEHLKK